MSETAILAEISVTAPDESVTTLYFSDTAIRPFRSSDADRPDRAYDPRIADVASISLDLAVDLSRLDADIGGGELRISNTDGALGYLRDYTFGGISLYWGVAGAAFSDYLVLLKGSCGSPRFEGASNGPRRLIVPVSDPREALDAPIQSTLYAGTNSGAGTGYEGTEDDLADRPKPLAYGDLTAANISPPWANAEDLVLQVHDGPYEEVTALYSGGGDAGLTLHGVSTGAAFDGVSLDPDEYEEDRTRGLVKLGGTLTGRVTLDLQGDKPAAWSNLANVLIPRILDRMGVGSGDIGTSFLTPTTEGVGLWLDTEARASDVVALLARSIGAWVIPDRLGVWQIGRLAAPAGEPAATFDAGSIIRLETDPAAEEEPVHRVTVRYKRNYTVMSAGELAGSVIGTAREAYLAAAWRTAVASDADVLAAYPRARAIEIETALVAQADAQALADLWMTLFGVKRRALRVTVPMTSATLALELGATVQVTDEREGIDLPMLIVGKEPASPRRTQITFRVWG